MFAGVEAPGLPALPSVPSAAALPASEEDVFQPAVSPQRAPDALGAGVLKRKFAATAPPERVFTPQGAGASPTSQSTYAEGSVNPAHYPVKEPIIGKIFVFIIGALVLSGAIVGGWFVYTKYFFPPITPNPVTPAPIEPVPVTPESPAINPGATTPEPTPTDVVTTTSTTSVVNDSILFGQTVDTDKDGLDDARERELGTNPNNSDSDADGLGDADEVLIWKTDPLNPDTDGDGHQDGKEVRNGYDPLGSGKLLLTPTSTAPTSTR